MSNDVEKSLIWIQSERKTTMTNPTGTITSTLVLLLVFLSPGLGPAQQRERTRVPKPEPDFAAIKYGPHERNVLDL